MTAKLAQIIDQLNAMAAFKASKAMIDDEFIAGIEAVCVLCNLQDDLGLDRKSIGRRVGSIYRELSRRIYEKEDIQLALPLIEAMNSLMYAGSRRAWKSALVEMCRKAVDAYRKEPIISSEEYLFALDIVCCQNDTYNNPDIKEYKQIVAGYLEDIDHVSLAERIKRVGAYERSKHLFASEKWEKWAEIREQLIYADASQLDVESLLAWCKVTGQHPANVLKIHAVNSKGIMIEFLRSQIITELAKQDRARAKRQLARELKTLNDDIIGDIIPLKIDDKMSVSTLFALETIYYLRLQLAQATWDEKEPTYNALCRDRFEKIANALRKKYTTASSINEKIEILERLSFIGEMIHSSHSNFAIAEADNLKESPGLTYAQSLRLDWIPSITSENESDIVAKLLPEANTNFEIATLALISDFVTEAERGAIINRYFEQFDAALGAGNATELGSLLALAAHWNSDPTIRPRLTEAAAKASAIATLPERLVNPIAATISSLTSQYEEIA